MFNYTKEEIQEKIKSIGPKYLGRTIELDEIEYIGEGYYNKIYSIDDKIFRFSKHSGNKSWDKNKFYAEKYIIEKISESTNIPVPEVYDIISFEGFSLIIQNKIPGECIEKRLKNNKNIDIKYIGNQLAESLKQMHNIKTKNYGLFKSNGEGEFESFDEMIKNDIEKGITNLINLNLFREERINEIKEIIYNNLDLIYCKEPRLVLNDINPKNILIDDYGSIEGIVDFEFCRSADPLHDVAKMIYLNDRLPGIYEGFENNYNLSWNEEEINLYNLIVRAYKLQDVKNEDYILPNMNSLEEKIDYSKKKIEEIIKELS